MTKSLRPFPFRRLAVPVLAVILSASLAMALSVSGTISLTGDTGPTVVDPVSNGCGYFPTEHGAGSQRPGGCRRS